MILARLRGAGRWALLAGLLLGVIGLAPAEAEAKRIEIKTRFDPGEAWRIGRPAVTSTRPEAAAAAGMTAPGRAEAAQARARAALAAERAGVEATARTGQAGPPGDKASAEAVVCIAGC
jgi:hypothetical protein